MKSISLLVFILSIFYSLVAGASIPRYLERYLTTRKQLDTNQARAELGGRLSKEAVIFGPEDPRFHNATSKWNSMLVPQVKVVVFPGRESDVSKIVEYCNDNSINFLAMNRRHGWTQSLGSFNGVQINMASLASIKTQPSGKSAWFDGGAYGGQVMRYLWDRGYVTTHGSCDCVGVMGPGLGGGHGRHEGLYGMISDNIIQMNVVLASGKAVRVSKNSYSDLFWAMRGAGHNFGIVTSFELNIFPRGPDTWHFHNYIWRGDKLEAVFNALNKFHNNGTTPVDMAINFGYFQMNTTITDTEPIISWSFAYRGSAKAAREHLKPFNVIGAVYEESGDVPYPEISVIQQTDENSFVCQYGYTRITSTAGLQVYNVTSERQIFDAFTNRVASNPALAAGSAVLHEGYSTKAVQAQNPKDSAYPFRDDHHLMFVLISVPSDDSTLEHAGREWANEVRGFWNKGQPERAPNTYVNYATGLEPVEEMYGHEAWRLKRLRDLKAKYDPSNRFRFYNPIIRE
ncbi:hypothetical protein CSUB01_10237 [Colletotrichum sublineola]|uniref:FAD-binding PCMH-type domain-containing protein n=1 Tax=Colletotrichum sublineola TaxID=1173701 RepID=A0A066X220_COLSU|nr:hypothetical protein CSUB01_10237 [Colletotrichum sublineola]